jgi:hypothetical protein
VIVRIVGDGQYEFPDDQADRLNELDNQLVTVVESGDEGQFTQLWAEMVKFVRGTGSPLADDELKPSDVILPPEDITLSEAAHEFTGEGLIPD